jgi:putative DNA primase/helicase
MHGCYRRIGPRVPDDADGAIIVCESHDAGITINEATGLPAIVAYDACNLGPVAQVVRDRKRRAKILITPGDYRWANSPRRDALAWKAAESVGATVLIPRFTDIDENPFPDFSDLHSLEGLDAVRDQVMAAAA